MNNDNEKGPQASEGAGAPDDPAATQCFGVNILKAARYANLIVGAALVVIGVMSFLAVFDVISSIFANPGQLILNLYLM